MNLSTPTLPCRPVDPRTVRAGAARSSLASLRLRSLLVPVFLKILWLHCVCPQGRQFDRLGRRRCSPLVPLPESWAHGAIRRIGRFVFRMPWIRRRACYWRSQMIFDLLPRFGFPVRMHLGLLPADPAPGQGIAHLWVSLRGELLGDAADGPEAYVELAVYPTETTRD
jgi:hypothetical protein